ncbi:Threonylcarbamoyl-AMP synthase [Rosistilla carotiformis]|uniref:Threonylcarbamoyl-AMP synthase n=1 Tax=Rosistilla carotiformis TaxID=2528017 RepID=A0A518JXE4_9BACT|nr:L-threonylcarbamoyladenylate synthase [Rosistilla carotiformis]QDV70209.1 Threonylcarbamoyl-AMP synthase [Rosistilla carotiformis]
MSTQQTFRSVPPTDDAIDSACRFLAAGELIGVPTETVYGLAANALDAAAVRKIFAAKGRPDNNPLIVHVADLDAMQQVVRWPLDPITMRQFDAIVDLWPGPLTIVLPRSDRLPAEVTAGQSTVAVRIPSHPVMQQLLRRSGLPLAAPSANRSKYVSPTTAAHVVDGLGDRVAMVLDGGACSVGLESTIVALGERPRLLRPGAITAETLASRWNVPVEALLPVDQQPVVLEAPGMMLQHYSPQTPLWFAERTASTLQGRIGRIAFAPLPDNEREKFAVVRVLSPTGDLEEVGQRLFAVMRELDSMALDAIVTDTCPPHGVGRAIMDRLKRAAFRE